MKLQNGCYYKREDGSVVKAQIEGDDMFHCYDNEGQQVARVGVDSHVNGWTPVGAAAFKKEELGSVKKAEKKVTKKKAKKKAD